MSDSDETRKQIRKQKPDADADETVPPPQPQAEDELPTVRLTASLVAEIERRGAWLTAPETENTSSGDDSMPTLDLPTAEIARVEALAIETTVDLPPAESTGEATADRTLEAIPIDVRARVLPFDTQRKIEVPAAALELTRDVEPDGLAPAVALELTTDLSPEAFTLALAGELTTDVLPESLAQPEVPFAGRAPEPKDAGLSLADAAAIASDLEGGSLRSVLETHGLSHEAWISAERLWVARIAAELERGETTLRDAHDDAFREARAMRRGAFELDAVAELVAELEAGASDSSAEMGADVADAMRFLRGRRRRGTGVREAFARARARRDARSESNDRASGKDVS